MPVGFVSLFISQHFSVLMCYHDNMITHKTDFVNPHSYIGEISSFVTKSFWASINYLILANYSKVQFYKNITNSLTLSPNPFPRKGAILLGLPPLVPVGGYAPQPNYLITIEVFRQSAIYLYKSVKSLLTVTHKSEMLIRKFGRTSASGCS